MRFSPQTEPPQRGERVQQYYADDTPLIEPEPVSWQQWRCCADICRSEPSSVLREDKEFIICNCKTGKIFKISKIK